MRIKRNYVREMPKSVQTPSQNDGVELNLELEDIAVEENLEEKTLRELKELYRAKGGKAGVGNIMNKKAIIDLIEGLNK